MSRFISNNLFLQYKAILRSRIVKSNNISCNYNEEGYPLLHKKFGCFNLELHNNGNMRVLTSDKNGINYEQSNFNIPRKQAQHDYARIMLKTIGKYDNKKILVFGGAGASIPYEIVCNSNNTNITIVDNSLDSINLGKYVGKYITKNNTNIEWHLSDAKDFVSTIQKKYYDIIICDIFNIHEGVIPHFVNDISFLVKIKSSLKDKGIYLQNILDESPDEYYHQLSVVFTNIYVNEDLFAINNLRRNYVFIAN